MITEHSWRFELVKGYYDRRMWNKNRVRIAVRMEWITSEEYTEITGELYPA